MSTAIQRPCPHCDASLDITPELWAEFDEFGFPTGEEKRVTVSHCQACNLLIAEQDDGTVIHIPMIGKAA